MTALLTFGVVALLGVLIAQGWMLIHLRGQHGRIAKRLDRLGEGLARRRPVPAARFDAVALNGERVTSGILLAAGKPVVLVFGEPRCGPCYDLLADLGGWQRVYGDQLTFALVSGGAAEINRAITAEYGIAPGAVLLQAEREIAEAFGVRMLPAALLLAADGRTPVEPVYGVPAVRGLVAATLGLVLPDAPATATRVAGKGEPAPRLRRPDLDGAPIEIGGATGEPALLVFWSPGCSHCQDLLPDLKEWDADPSGPRMVIVSRGPAALSREIGFRSPVALDDDRTIAAAFGARGTPAAVIIDGLGVVASDVARGAAGVRSLVATRFTRAALAR